MGNSDNYPTPEWLMKLFKDFFDPCPLNPEPTFDALTMSEFWPDRTYINPPYSNPMPWVEKAIEQSKKGKYIVMLLPVDTSTKWYAKLVEAKAEIFFYHGRMRFIKGCPRFASMLVILDGTNE